MLAAGCKPASEPEYPWGDPPPHYPRVAEEPDAGEAPVAAVPARPRRPRAPLPGLEAAGLEAAGLEAAGLEAAGLEAAEVEPAPGEPGSLTPPERGAGAPDAGPAPSGDADAAGAPGPEGIDAAEGGGGEDAAAPAENAADAGAPVPPGGAEAGADAGAEDAAPPSTEIPELLPALRESLGTRPTRKQRLEARRLNRLALKTHKSKDLDGAVALYLQALAQDPGSEWPRYNLACACSMLGRKDDVLQHLLALAHTQKGDRLAAARVDPDFEPMRSDPRFRKVTGYAEVVLLRGSGVPASTATDFAKVVEKVARYIARDGSGPAPAGGSTVFYRDGFQSQAGELAEIMRDTATAPAGPELRRTGGDVIVYIARPDDVVGAAAAELERFVGAKLRGRKAGALHDLRLKTTGFFSWTIFDEASDRQTKRNGTFKVDGDFLVLSYSETRETEGDVEGPDEKEEKVDFRVDGQDLVVDGVSFRR